MVRQRKPSPERKAFISGLLQHYEPEAAQDVQDMLKDLLGDAFQDILALFDYFYWNNINNSIRTSTSRIKPYYPITHHIIMFKSKLIVKNIFIMYE